eukprot:SAG31_NODE_25898_length_452_cov_0.583569_1_plen_71_part_10
MPTILLIKDAKVVERIEGFTELGMTEHFSTAALEKLIKKKGKVIDACVMEEEEDDFDDFDPDFDLDSEDD